jgi:hypothetical protein
VREHFPFLQAGSNWNNSDEAGLSYRNSNNVATNSNRNIGTQLELKVRNNLEQHFDLTRVGRIHCLKQVGISIERESSHFGVSS